MGSKAAPFRALIETLRNETQGLPLQELVEVVVAKSGLIEHYKTEREGADRIENLAELVNAAAAFTEEEREVESGEAADPLTSFLTHAALEAGVHLVVPLPMPLDEYRKDFSTEESLLQFDTLLLRAQRSYVIEAAGTARPAGQHRLPPAAEAGHGPDGPRRGRAPLGVRHRLRPGARRNTTG